MGSIRGEEVVDGVDKKKLFVAVSKQLKACKSVLLWALQNAGGKRVCLIHIHQPAQTIPLLGGRFPISSFSEQAGRAYHEKDKQEISNILDKYLCLCAKEGVEAEKLYVEMDSVEKGILELISQHKIERLVMGAATDKKYSRKMTEPKSKKANYVRQHAPAFCHTWFICKGNLIYTREGIERSHLNDGNKSGLTSFKPSSSISPIRCSTHSRVDSDGSFDNSERASTFSLSRLSGFTDSTSTTFSKAEERETLSWSLALPPRPNEKQHHSSSSSTITLRESILYDELGKAMIEVVTTKREANEESMKRRKAEKHAIDAIHKANAVENLYHKELRRRIEVKQELAEAKEELKRTKEQRDRALEQLRAVMDHKLSLAKRVQESDAAGRDLEERITFALEYLENYTKQ